MLFEIRAVAIGLLSIVPSEKPDVMRSGVDRVRHGP
jgi:hypothetical protein